MTVILEIHDWRCDGDDLVVDAVVEDAGVALPGTATDPPEYGPALCRGSLHISTDTLIPATDAELIAMLEREISDWQPIQLD
jgi:hypothetical protein